MPNKKTIERDGTIYFAELYHWRQTYPNVGPWGIYLRAYAFNKDTKEPVKIKRVSVMMGNHPNYFPGWDFGNDSRMFRENSSSHNIGPWYSHLISSDYIGGNAFFDLTDGTRLEIKDISLKKPNNDFSVGPIDIITISFLIDEEKLGKDVKFAKVAGLLLFTENKNQCATDSDDEQPEKQSLKS